MNGRHFLAVLLTAGALATSARGLQAQATAKPPEATCSVGSVGSTGQANGNTAGCVINNYYGVAPPKASAPPGPADHAGQTASVQFTPANYNSGAFAVILEPCVQTGAALDCNVRVTPASERGPLWWFDRNSAVQDEDGVKTAPTWVSLEGKTYNLMNGGKGVPLMPGVSTLVKYHFDNIKDATKLQAFSLTFCCTRNVPFLREK